MPHLAEGQHPERRNRAVAVHVSQDVENIRRELAALEYETRTRGKRFVPAATLLGEGRYQLLRHRGHTELAYAPELPKRAGPAQHEFEIQEEASYIVAVKNPTSRRRAHRRRSTSLDIQSACASSSDTIAGSMPSRTCWTTRTRSFSCPRRMRS